MSTGLRGPIGVHTLSEFVFCPRAGIISHHQQTPDSGQDFVADLSYTPEYDVMAIQPKMDALRKEVLRISLGISVWIVFVAVACLFVPPFVTFLCFVVSLPIAIYLATKLVRKDLEYRRLKWQLEQYHKAQSRKPDLTCSRLEVFSWLSLLKTFDVESCHDPFIDEDLGLAGSPWKLLRSGKYCFPVFFCKKPTTKSDRLKSDDDPLAYIYPQHKIRMTAYCNLIESCTTAESPCGIIVFAGTYTAIAIKRGEKQEAESVLDRAMDSARKTLAIFGNNEQVAEPAVNICSGCHLGRPRVYGYGSRTLLRNGIEKTAVLHQIGTEENAKSYHSACGDFFDWVPPHADAIEKGLNGRRI